jgi:hypothetical protein
MAGCSSTLPVDRHRRLRVPGKACSAEARDRTRPFKDAEKFAASGEAAWERLSSVFDETRNLADAWPTLDETGRKTLLDYWVYNGQIAVEPIPGMKRANEKFAVVTLRSAPNDPRFFAPRPSESERLDQLQLDRFLGLRRQSRRQRLKFVIPLETGRRTVGEKRS